MMPKFRHWCHFFENNLLVEELLGGLKMGYKKSRFRFDREGGPYLF